MWIMGLKKLIFLSCNPDFDGFVAGENVRAFRRKSGNHLLANLPTRAYKYRVHHTILCIQLCPNLRGLTSLPRHWWPRRPATSSHWPTKYCTVHWPLYAQILAGYHWGPVCHNFLHASTACKAYKWIFLYDLFNLTGRLCRTFLGDYAGVSSPPPCGSFAYSGPALVYSLLLVDHVTCSVVAQGMSRVAGTAAQAEGTPGTSTVVANCD